jgi:hypothetical protein
VLLEMEGRPIADAAAFGDALAKARAAGRVSVRVVVLRLDRSRFVDLRLDGPAEECVKEPTAPEPPTKDDKDK